MKAIFTTFLLAFGLVVVQAQCPTGNVYLNTQTEVDAFGVSWPSCTDFPDTLTINGDDITNLLGLSGLMSVGNLTIEVNGSLTSLTGLENLSSIGGDFSIAGNHALTSLAGLENLSELSVGLYIVDNDALTSLVGVENLSL